jgi:hypothetical protein
MARQRAAIQDTELYDILQRAVVSLNWLRYGETMAAKRQPKMLVPHRKFYKELMTATNGKLCITKAQWTRVVNRVAEDRKKWFLHVADSDDWVATMTSRLQVSCRHLSQGLVKKTRPKWVCDLLGVPKKVAKSSDGGEEGDGDEGAGPVQGLRAQNFIKIH